MGRVSFEALVSIFALVPPSRHQDLIEKLKDAYRNGGATEAEARIFASTLQKAAREARLLIATS